MSWVNVFEIPLHESVEASELPRSKVAIFTEVESDYLLQIEGLTPRAWAELPSMERLHCLQELEDRLAEMTGRPPMELEVETLGKGEYGYFDSSRGVIVVSEMVVNNVSPLDAIDTVAHEGRHAYQHEVVLHPEIHNDPVEVAVWKDNLDNYLTVDLYGYELYRSQPVEKDAWTYGEDIRAIFDEKSAR